jgi:hypothetical protein
VSTRNAGSATPAARPVSNARLFSAMGSLL